MRVVASGLEWMGSGVGSIQTAFDELLLSAQHEVVIVTYALTSGAEDILTHLEHCLGRGVRVTIMMNRLNKQDPVALAWLNSLADTHSQLGLYDFDDPSGADLHTKLLIVDREKVLIGSANLSWNGLVRNHELAILLDDAVTVQAVANATDRLFRSNYSKRIQLEDLSI